MDRGSLNGVSMSDFPLLVSSAVQLALITMIIATRRTKDDRRWALSILVSIAASPLGWAYYLPLAFLPALASWRPAGWIGVTIVAIPIPIAWNLTAHSPALAIVIGSLYSLATIALWFAWWSPAHRQASFAAARAIPRSA
jgi:hypothetical protein